jgi:hypothetical protein
VRQEDLVALVAYYAGVERSAVETYETQYHFLALVVTDEPAVRVTITAWEFGQLLRQHTPATLAVFVATVPENPRHRNTRALRVLAALSGIAEAEPAVVAAAKLGGPQAATDLVWSEAP